jgi:hypothetical protein
MRTLEDLTNQQFGNYKVLRRDYSRKIGYWICLCLLCNRGRSVLATNLKSGHSQNCHGCSTRTKWEGKKVGHVTILKYIGSSDNNTKSSNYLCRCDCGKEFECRAESLKARTTCGCFSYGYKNRSGNLAFNQCISAYKQNAKKRNLSFNLTKDKFRELTQMNCVYCGQSPSNKERANASLKNAIPHPDFIYNGIDRIDPTKGYEESNVVACCRVCNWMKSDLSKEEFIAHIKTVLHYLTPDSKATT